MFSLIRVCAIAVAAVMWPVLPPPIAPQPVVDHYPEGHSVVDPYRQLEDLKSPGVQGFFKREADYTQDVLAQLGPGRDRLHADIGRLTIDPYFLGSRFAWLDAGGVWVVAHVRGGGEYGEDWHLAGKGPTKQHTIDDVIAAAQYLIGQKYTAPAHLAIEGTSAGGITVGGAITQHPELFAAALDVVGATDALRSETEPNGPANVWEFGSSKNADGFRALYAMDAHVHIVDGRHYPAVLGVTGINDPRVAPWQVAKFVARLRHASASGRPVLMRVDYDAGHGLLAASRGQTVALLTDEFSFLLWRCGSPEFAGIPLAVSAKDHS